MTSHQHPPVRSKLTPRAGMFVERVVKVKGFHNLRIQKPPEGKHLMVIQHMGFKGDVTDWPMRMSWLGGMWRWEPSGMGSSTYPTHWRFRVAGDERFDNLPAFAPEELGL